MKFETVFRGIHVKTIGGIDRPRHLAFAKTGETVVCEQNASCMKVFDSNHRLLRSFGNTGQEESRLFEPRGVAISSDNTVFVVGGNHCVMKFTLESQFIASVGSKGSGQLQFNTPYAIAYNHTNNRVYVCDTCNHRITILNHDLTFHGSFGSKGSEEGQFNKPEGISVDRKGNVLVADHYNNRIQVFDTNGRYLSSITHTTPGQGLQGSMSVAVGPDDWVYVVEFGCARVSVFDENGKYIKSFGKRGDKDGEFKNPYAIAVSDDGRVFVSDTDNNRVQVFQ
jgi:DNA-binding beta-propeller fold protein YncE